MNGVVFVVYPQVYESVIHWRRCKSKNKTFHMPFIPDSRHTLCTMAQMSCRAVQDRRSFHGNSAAANTKFKTTRSIFGSRKTYNATVSVLNLESMEWYHSSEWPVLPNFSSESPHLTSHPYNYLRLEVLLQHPLSMAVLVSCSLDASSEWSLLPIPHNQSDPKPCFRACHPWASRPCRNTCIL